MATAEAVETAATPGDHAHDDHGHDHPEWLAHHFETADQQFDAGKLGIWLFLAQEVLFFTGLFVAYAVYRANHPEVFVGASKFLNPTLGALNTIVLLASSLAIAWGVRAAQKNQQDLLMWLHIFTLACAGLFMGVKVVEYSYKFDEGLYWAGSYSPTHLTPGEGLHAQLHWVFIGSLLVGGLISLGGYMMHALDSSTGSLIAGAGWLATAFYTGSAVSDSLGIESSALVLLTTLTVTAVIVAAIKFFIGCFVGDRKAWGAVALGLGMCIVGMSVGVVVARGIQAGAGEHHASDGHAADGHAEDGHGDAAHGDAAHSDEGHAGDGDHSEAAEGDASLDSVPVGAVANTPQIGVNQGNFFSIYFAMTGVHALHIFAGIAVIAWIIGRIARGDFSPAFYGPVEFVGLYWHLVDLVWIYLFPLLYLIH